MFYFGALPAAKKPIHLSRGKWEYVWKNVRIYHPTIEVQGVVGYIIVDQNKIFLIKSVIKLCVTPILWLRIYDNTGGPYDLI